ncbi:MAG: thiamine pyrophosphate-binding protein [Alphaproteobacteria bacterium]|nr:thiamine pyrophosphate-binding protein [Alphaproteobacteria bacterium]
MAKRHGGEVLAAALKAEGVARVFSVPGESFLAALDGLLDSGIENIVCRQEGGAAMMAEAHGKLTGAPGVLFVTRGPGASNASSGIHVAMQDSTPMVVFVGQIDSGHRDREAFQEVDYRAFFGQFAKWVAEVGDTARLPECIHRAFHMARSGRPGPVVLALPENVLSARTGAPDRAPTAPAYAAVTDAQIGDLTAHLQASHRPLIVLGGSGWSAEAATAIEAFATRQSLPVAVTFRRQDRIDNDAPVYAGDLGVGMNPALAQRLRDTDCLLLLGTRLSDIATQGYTLVDPAAPSKTILHVHPDPGEIGKVYPADLAVVAPPADVALKLAGVDSRLGDWADWCAAARADYKTWQRPKETPGAVKMEAIIAGLGALLGPEDIVTNGAGNYAAFLHRYFRFRRYGTQVAPTSGSMGYGLPAAIAAKLEHPARTVVCLAGDGCFQMTGNEFSTAMQHEANVIVIVANNGRYGTIRMHQEKTYPGRVSGTDLANPDFAALARAYGGHGETVTATEDFPAAFARAKGAGVPAIIELKIDPEALSTGLTLGETRAMGQAAQAK